MVTWVGQCPVPGAYSLVGRRRQVPRPSSIWHREAKPRGLGVGVASGKRIRAEQAKCGLAAMPRGPGWAALQALWLSEAGILSQAGSRSYFGGGNTQPRLSGRTPPNSRQLGGSKLLTVWERPREDCRAGQAKQCMHAAQLLTGQMPNLHPQTRRRPCSLLTQHSDKHGCSSPAPHPSGSGNAVLRHKWKVHGRQAPFTPGRSQPDTGEKVPQSTNTSRRKRSPA